MSRQFADAELTAALRGGMTALAQLEKEEWQPMGNITKQQWKTLGLRPQDLVLWELLPAAVQGKVIAVRSVVLDDGWIVCYPDPADGKRDVVLVQGLRRQHAQDAAAVLRGEIKMSDLRLQ